MTRAAHAVSTLSSSIISAWTRPDSSTSVVRDGRERRPPIPDSGRTGVVRSQCQLLALVSQRRRPGETCASLTDCYRVATKQCLRKSRPLGAAPRRCVCMRRPRQRGLLALGLSPPADGVYLRWTVRIYGAHLRRAFIVVSKSSRVGEGRRYAMQGWVWKARRLARLSWVWKDRQ